MASVEQLHVFNGAEPGKTYLLLISPEKIPHLVLVSDQKYYSLTHKKSVIGEPFETYFRFLKRSGRKMIFLELDKMDKDPKTVFSAFNQANTFSVTCLNPVKECLSPQSEAQFVYELVPELYALNLIKKAYQLNMDFELDKNGDFELVEYSREAIFSYIQELNEKYAGGEQNILKDT